MAEKNDERKRTAESSPSYRVRLPGFIVEEEVGLGDIVKQVTYGIGIQPCGGCQERAAALNRWMVFAPGSRKTQG